MVVEGLHRGAELYGYALFDGFVDQDFIETGTLHIERGRRAGGDFVGKFEAGIALAPREGEAVFILKTESGLHGGQEAGLMQQLHAVRQQALADNETREMLLFHHTNIESPLVQQSSRHCPRGAGADDNDVVMLNHVFPLFFASARLCRQ